MTSIIKLQNVSKHYKLGQTLVKAVNKCSFEIKSGEFVSIVGPSGSGKSTLMHLIGLLDTPTSGNIFLKGKDVGFLSSSERAILRNKHIGFVFQSFNLLPKTTALENVSLPLLYSGIPKKTRIKKSKKSLEMVGLGDRLNHTSSQLSGGQQQRVAIARALVNNPDLILADEPTGNLDSKSGAEIINIFKALNKKGNTIILVTHESNIAKKTKRIISIKDGKIKSDKKIK